MDLDTLCVYKDVERGVTSRSLRERQEIANTVLRTREGIWLRGRTKLGLAILSNFGSNEDVNAMWLRVGLVCPATRVFIPDLSVITNTFSLHPEDIDILATF